MNGKLDCPICGAEAKTKKVITMFIDRNLGQDEYKMQAMQCTNNGCKFCFLFETN